MATKRVTSANIARVLRTRGYNVVPIRDISRRCESGLRVTNWVKPGVVEICIKNFGGTLNMGDTVVNVKYDLLFEGYDVRIGYGDAGEDQTVLYVHSKAEGAR